ncbi:hypothetical protein [Desulfobotulus mexicanus]|uniref:Uncharacterized protein n=1 Tax=Desulfobotulus mexicanus TaxID=2586642 RepID=A0A5S5MBY8_9BACT|nr:hypothetical protein [Desulfobotulus mexicanus]TYT73191.1 hypothetical protein FIM25_16420 [Desulfobotulus mexicanus]
MKKISLFLTALIFISTSAFALEKREFAFMGALGANYPLDDGDGQVSPVVMASYINYIGDNMYNEARLTTTTLSNTFGVDRGRYHFGIQPILAHTIEGGFRTFDQGYLNEDLNINGNYIAPVMFFDYRLADQKVEIKFKYRPSFYFYREEDSKIKMPDNHLAHVGSTELVFQNMEEKNMGRIKHGVRLATKYEYMNRSGYDSNGVLTEDINQSHKLYADLGFYHNFAGDYNLLFDINGAYQKDVDINNAEKIGSYLAPHAKMPGYYNCEFRHDRYVIGKIQFGIPVDFWETRIQPGFNILYMPKDNKVVGQSDYDETTYKSVSLNISTKLGGVLPFFLNYSYGIDAERKSSSDGKVSKGSHEIMAFAVVGFGSTGKR